MRSHKYLAVSATMLATITATGLSLADNPPGTTSPPASGAPQVPPDVVTPITPSTPTTTPSTTTPTQPPTPPPTSTTTVTAADTDPTMAPSMPPPTRESIIVYERQIPNRPLLITGGFLFVGTYATTAAFVGANGNKGDQDLYIPVAGPWINLSERSCTGDCGDHKRDTVLIAGSGVLQGIGAAMVITSFLIPEKVAKAQISAGPVKMLVTPTAGAGAGGLGAVGTF